MIKKKYICAKCERHFIIELLEPGEPLPPNTSRSSPRCECGSTALIDPANLGQ